MPQKQILIVENDGIIASRIADVLTDRGYAARSAASGEEAVAAAKAAPPDLTLMDIHLSREMDGVTAAERIRAIHDAPVVFLTAFSDDALLQRAKRASPHGFLIKPVRDRELLATLEIALYKHETDQRLQREREKIEAERRELAERLQYVRKMESLGTMGGAVAHHFNNLLSVILGHTEMIQYDPATDPSLQKALNEILKAGMRAREIIQEILVHQGKFPVRAGSVNLSELAREMWPMIETAAGRRADLRRELDDGLPRAALDPDRVRQAVVHLVSNAAEAIGDGPGTITVRTGALQADASFFSEPYQSDRAVPGPYVFVSVADTGEGMAPEIREKIFDPFFTTRFQGRGLGLPAVLGIARAHGGGVKVVSRPGSGTTIQVLFPAAA